MPDAEWVEVRATITLNGLRRGAVVLVDPDDPFISLCLRNQYLVPA
jgi:hypothetical protein